ncbi:MAG: sigma 54-interacting transcriptional regulator [Deltaproteobacteria bacterium]|nr:sigma 54-interacting transcriptional regulator [Deltaproteobacteria bacterium]
MSRKIKPPKSKTEPSFVGISTEAILESISDGVFTVNDEWIITSFNRAAERITGIAREDAIGRRCSEVFRASMCETACALRHTIETGAPIVNRMAFIVDSSGKRIPISVSTALLRDEKARIVGGAETFRDLTLIEELRRELRGRFRIGDMVSRSPAMRRIFDILPQIAESEATILIQGETGTGKELMARALHGASKRRAGPFIAVNCGALPDTLLESELFGYKAGAFTGAIRDKPGRFTMANGGTVFLDEISEVTPALQVRLLRVLQERVFEPLGATKTQETNARVIVATNRDLADLVKKGGFRQDLFYRINVMKIELPALRNRQEDIPLLIEHFISLFNATTGKSILGVSPDVQAILLAHDYPGNVRELHHIIERAFILCTEDRIELNHLPPEIVPLSTKPGRKRRKIVDSVRAIEGQAIKDALERNHYNRVAAARDLGIHKSTLFRKAKTLGLVLPDQDGRSKRNR